MRRCSITTGMHLYVVTTYRERVEWPDVLPVSLDTIWKIESSMDDTVLDRMEEEWNARHALVGVYSYLELRDYYYILSSTPYPASEHYAPYSVHLDRHVKWYHMDGYVKPLLKQWISRFQQRQRTRAWWKTCKKEQQGMDHPLQEVLQRIQEGTWDTSFLHRIRVELEEEREIEARYQPEGEGAKEAQREFESIRKKLKIERSESNSSNPNSPTSTHDAGPLSIPPYASCGLSSPCDSLSLSVLCLRGAFPSHGLHGGSGTPLE